MHPLTEIGYFLSWYFLSTVAGLIGLPLSFRFFSRLPGRGVAYARILGLLVVGYIFWLLGSFGLLRNTTSSMVFVILLVVAAGLVLLRRRGLAELAAWLKSEWRAVLAVEMLFLVAFAGWALVRAYNPDISGTEKPMEYMFLNSILESPGLPPRDAWLSGHAISYYYFGYFLAAMVTRLGGTPPAVAFNLSLALWFGLAACASLGVVQDLFALAEQRRSNVAEARRSPLLRAFFPALMAPLLLLVVGNLYGVLGVAHANGWFAALRLPAVYYDFGEVSTDGKSLVETPGVRAGWVNAWEWLDLKRLNSPPDDRTTPARWGLDNWFFAARVVHDRGLTGAEQEAIDENPAFSFLLGDLHPHVLSLPFVLLAAALALQWLLAGWGFLQFQTGWFKQEAVNWLLSAVILGSLLALNTWDFPIYAGLVLLALGAGAGLALGWDGMKKALPQLIFGWIALVVLSFLLYLPFFLTFQSQAGGILPNVLYPTRFQQLMVMFAPLLAGIIIFLTWLRIKERGTFDRRAGWISGAGILGLLVLASVLLAWAASQLDFARPYIDQLLAPLSLQQALPVILQRWLVDGATALGLTLLVGTGMGLVVGAIRSKESIDSPLRQPALLFVLLLSILGALLVLVPEFLYLRDNFSIRMNTLFKFYFQAWVVWSLTCAFGLGWLWRFGGKWMRLVAALGAGIPILLGLVFLPASLWSKTAGWAVSPTLDGMSYFAQQYPQDWAAIQWLKENAQKDAVILEGSRGAYWVEGRSSRISMATGLSTLLGWANHEGQWRGAYYDKVAGREEIIKTIYQARDWENVKEFLEQFQVEYVVVSDLERGWYRPLQEAKFQQHMREVFRSGDLTIYQKR